MLDDRHILWEEGQHTESLILNADEIIKSPGIPETAPMVVKAKEKGINIISVAVDAPQDVISALAGKIGRISGVTAKTVYSPAE